MTKIDWEPDDEVTTTCGSIWSTQEEHYQLGVKAERERLINILVEWSRHKGREHGTKGWKCNWCKLFERLENGQ